MSVMLFDVNWITFKESGKYYSSGRKTLQFLDDLPVDGIYPIWKIWERARIEILLQSSMTFMVITEVEKHPHDHPVLLFRHG